MINVIVEFQLATCLIVLVSAQLLPIVPSPLVPPPSTDSPTQIPSRAVRSPESHVNKDLDMRELDEAIDDFESLERSETKFTSEKVDYIRSTSDVFDIGSLDEVMRKIDNEAKTLGLACPSDTVFIVDDSRSDRNLMERYIEYILKMIQSFTISPEIDSVGVMTFNGEQLKDTVPLGFANEHFKLVNEIKDLMQSPKKYSPIIRLLSQITRRTNTKMNFVVLTDGYSETSIDNLVRHLKSISNAKIYLVNFQDFERKFRDLSQKVDLTLNGEYSYGRLGNIIKNCGQEMEKRSQIPTSTIKTIETATDASGRFLIPNPQFIGDWIYHYNDKPSGKLKVFSPINQPFST